MLANAETFGTSPELLAADAAGGWPATPQQGRQALRHDAEPAGGRDGVLLRRVGQRGLSPMVSCRW